MTEDRAHGFRIEDGVPYINDQPFPWAKPGGIRCEDRRDSAGGVRHRRGFHLGFKNGWTLSIQFGNYNYCSNYVVHGAAEFLVPCPDAEIAAWDLDGNWYDFGNDTVIGYQTPEDVLRWIEFFSAQPSHRGVLP